MCPLHCALFIPVASNEQCDTHSPVLTSTSESVREGRGGGMGTGRIYRSKSGYWGHWHRPEKSRK